jgi:hypothetical protein
MVGVYLCFTKWLAKCGIYPRRSYFVHLQNADMLWASHAKIGTLVMDAREKGTTTCDHGGIVPRGSIGVTELCEVIK